MSDTQPNEQNRSAESSLAGETGSVVSSFLAGRLDAIDFERWIHSTSWSIRLGDSGPDVELLEATQNLLIDVSDGLLAKHELCAELRKLIPPNG